MRRETHDIILSPRTMTPLSVALFFCATVLTAQVRGVVTYLDPADSAEALVGGYIAAPDERTIVVETIDRTVAIRRQNVRRVELLRKRTGESAMVAGLTGLYAPIFLLPGGGTDSNCVPCGRHRFYTAGDGDLLVAVWSAFGFLGGGLVGAVIDGVQSDQRTTFKVDPEENRRAEETWAKLIDRLRGKSEEWRITVGPGLHLMQANETMTSRHSTLAELSSTSPHSFFTHGPAEYGSLTWVRATELSRRKGGGAEIGVGIYDLSRGMEASVLTIADATDSTEGIEAPIVSTVVGTGYGAIIKVQPLEEYLPERLRLRAGAGLGLAAVILNDRVRIETRNDDRSYSYFDRLYSPYALLSGELSVQLVAPLFIGLRGDLILLPSHRFKHPVPELRQPTESFPLSTATLGFLLGYTF